MSLSISQVATAADVNVQTIRYYERRGLFPTPRRTPAGYRQYTADAVARLRFIKQPRSSVFRCTKLRSSWPFACGTAPHVTPSSGKPEASSNSSNKGSAISNA